MVLASTKRTNNEIIKGIVMKIAMRSAAPVIASVFAVLLAGCLPAGEAETESETIRTVRTQIVGWTDPVSTRRFPAVLQPSQITPLAFDVGGRLGPVTLQIGQEVEAGDILATVEAQDATLRVQQAQAALAEAQVTSRNAQEEAERQQQLFQRGVVSAAARDRAVTSAQQADARVDQQARSLELVTESASDTALRAPFDGVVNTIEVQNFGTVAAGQPVVTLYQDNGLRATILVNYEMASELTLGREVTVMPDNGSQEPLRATVTEIARRAPAVSSFPVVVSLDETRPDLRPGMAVEVNITFDLPETLRGMPVPLSALATQRPAHLHDADNRTADVFVYSAGQGGTGTVEPRQVRIGAVVDDLLILTDGVEPGERIVTAGVPFLHPGQTVRLEQDVDAHAAESVR